MLRMLRIIGIVVFAFLVGLSANSLKNMQESGALLEKYNSQRKADITLLVFSFITLGALGYFELDRYNRASRKRTYDDRRFPEVRSEKAKDPDSTSIYAAPQTIDKWGGRRTRSSKPHSSKTKNKVVEAGSLWLVLLRVVCLLLPILYLGLLVVNLMGDHQDSLLQILLPALFGGLLLISLVTLIGVMAKKPWGLKLGYVLALCNLLIFPIGTASGLFLILGLVGASPVFMESAMASRRKKGRSAPRASAVI